MGKYAILVGLEVMASFFDAGWPGDGRFLLWWAIIGTAGNV